MSWGSVKYKKKKNEMGRIFKEKEEEGPV